MEDAFHSPFGEERYFISTELQWSDITTIVVINYISHIHKLAKTFSSCFKYCGIM